jgi:hypothetical protein
MKLIRRSFSLAVILTIALLLPGSPGSSLAARGSCGQPNSTGGMPLASDALGVLRASVGLDRCGLCVCDVDGNGLIFSSDALSVLRASVGLPATIECGICSGGAVTGTVLAPFASVEDTPPSTEGSGSLEPAPRVTVELHATDNAGVSQNLLNSTESGEDGSFFFPTSTGLGRNLMLRALNSTDRVVLRALATNEETDIEPASEFVLATVLDDLSRRGITQPLDNFTPQEYNGCVNQTRNLIPADPPTNLSDLISLLGAAGGAQLLNQIVGFAGSPDLTDALSGEHWVFTKNLYFHRSFTPSPGGGGASSNSRGVGIGGSNLCVTFDGAGRASLSTVSLTEFLLNETSGTISGGFNDGEKVNENVVRRNESETFPEPDAGYDIEPGGSVLLALDDGGTLPLIANDDFSLMALSDLENAGESTSRGFGFVFPKTTGADLSLFNGDYHVLEMLFSISLFKSQTEDFVYRETEFSVGNHVITADGDGDITFTPGNGGNLFMGKHGKGRNDLNPPTDPTIEIHLDANEDEDPVALEYTLGDDGAFTLKEDSSVIGAGAVSADGSFGIVQLNAFNVPGESGRSNSNLLTVIRKGSGQDEAALAGSFNLIGFEGGFYREFDAGAFNGNATVNHREVFALNTLGTINLEANGDLEITEIASNEAILSETSSALFNDDNPSGFVFDANVNLIANAESESGIPGTWMVEDDGKVTVNIDDLVLMGAFSADGRFFMVQGQAAEGSGNLDEGDFIVIAGFRNDAPAPP